jgi:hypothetical protein
VFLLQLLTILEVLNRRLLVVEGGALIAPTDRGTGANVDERALDYLVYLGSNLLHLVLAVEVALYYLIRLNEAIKLSLQFIVLLSQELLVAVKRVEFLPQVVVALY